MAIIASCYLVMVSLLLRGRNCKWTMSRGVVTARSEATRQSMFVRCHCKRCVAIHAGMKSWIATA